MKSNLRENGLVTQDEMDEMLRIHEIIDQGEGPNRHPSLLDEIRGAILDSGKLHLNEWRSLRRKIDEIEALIPQIDTIIRLKEQLDTRNRIIGENR